MPYQDWSLGDSIRLALPDLTRSLLDQESALGLLTRHTVQQVGRVTVHPSHYEEGGYTAIIPRHRIRGNEGMLFSPAYYAPGTVDPHAWTHNGAGVRGKAIIGYFAVHAEIDDRPLEEQWGALMSLPRHLRPTLICYSGGKSLHVMWATTRIMTPADAAEARKWAAHAVGGDTALVRHNQRARMPGYMGADRLQPVLAYHDYAFDPQDLLDALREYALATQGPVVDKPERGGPRGSMRIRYVGKAHQETFATLEGRKTNYRIGIDGSLVVGSSEAREVKRWNGELRVTDWARGEIYRFRDAPERAPEISPAEETPAEEGLRRAMDPEDVHFDGRVRREGVVRHVEMMPDSARDTYAVELARITGVEPEPLPPLDDATRTELDGLADLYDRAIGTGVCRRQVYSISQGSSGLTVAPLMCRVYGCRVCGPKRTAQRKVCLLGAVARMYQGASAVMFSVPEDHAYTCRRSLTDSTKVRDFASYKSYGRRVFAVFGLTLDQFRATRLRKWLDASIETPEEGRSHIIAERAHARVDWERWHSGRGGGQHPITASAGLQRHFPEIERWIRGQDPRRYGRSRRQMSIVVAGWSSVVRLRAVVAERMAAQEESIQVAFGPPQMTTLDLFDDHAITGSTEVPESRGPAPATHARLVEALMVMYRSEATGIITWCPPSQRVSPAELWSVALRVAQDGLVRTISHREWSMVPPPLEPWLPDLSDDALSLAA